MFFSLSNFLPKKKVEKKVVTGCQVEASPGRGKGHSLQIQPDNLLVGWFKLVSASIFQISSN